MLLCCVCVYMHVSTAPLQSKLALLAFGSIVGYLGKDMRVIAYSSVHLASSFRFYSMLLPM